MAPAATRVPSLTVKSAGATRPAATVAVSAMIANPFGNTFAGTT